MPTFAGKTFVVRVDETAAYSDGSTLTYEPHAGRGARDHGWSRRPRNRGGGFDRAALRDASYGQADERP